MKFQPPKGTRDFLPKDMAIRTRVFNKLREVLEKYGYGEVCTPAFEDFELLAKKSGPDIEKEIYTFTDKAGRKLGLRFDPTVPICRIVASDPSLPKPIKFYYITNMWRYDEPQAGRFREFWQIGVELIGSNRAEADAEILAIVNDCLKTLDIKEFYFVVNSRRIIESLIKDADIPENKNFDVFRAIDKLNKIGEDGVRKELERIEIKNESIDKLLNFIKTKKVSKEEEIELEKVIGIAKKMGVKNIKIDYSIARGIDYYTGFVFETFIKGSERIGSVASGGRYDTLIGLYGSQDVPATGFGIGIDRLLEILKIDEEYCQAKVFVVSVNDKIRERVIEIAQDLRKNGIKTDFDLMGRNLTKQLEYADSTRIPYVLIVGGKELKKKKFKLKDMKKKTEKELSLKSIIKKLISIGITHRQQ